MLKKYKLPGACFLLFLSLTLNPFLPGIQMIETAWSETDTLTDDQKRDPEIQDVQPWGAFRGWSPSVPYGQTSPDPINRSDSTDSLPVEVGSEISSSENEVYPSISENSNSSAPNDNDESWGAFRGWSPAVPYGN